MAAAPSILHTCASPRVNWNDQDLFTEDATGLDLIAPYDPNAARRCLRAHLLGMSRAFASPAHGVPHSFEPDRLLDFARDVLESGSGTRQQRLALHGHTAVAFGLHDRDRECRDLLERALRVASASAERAHVHYLLGHQYHQRRGEWRAAVVALEQTTQLIQAASMLRAFACVNLAGAYLELNELDRAQAAVNAALSTNIRDVEPHARARLALVLAKRGDLEHALEEGRRARERFRRIRSDSGVLSTDELLARIHLENGGAEEALPLLARARQLRFERLDLSQLGRRFHDEATALMEVDRHREAEGAYMQALRYHTGATRDAACAHTLRHLGAVLGNIGQVDDAIAMMHEAAALAARARHPVEEFSALTDLLELLKRHRSRLDAVPYVLSRCHTVMDAAAPDASPERLVALARTTMELTNMGAAMPHGGTIPQPPTFPIRRRRGARAKSALDTRSPNSTHSSPSGSDRTSACDEHRAWTS